MVDVLLKNVIEDLIMVLLFEILGFFAILLECNFLIIAFGSAYLLPSVRMTMNVAFANTFSFVFLEFQVFKLLTSILSIYFSYLIRYGHHKSHTISEITTKSKTIKEESNGKKTTVKSESDVEKTTSTNN